MKANAKTLAVVLVLVVALSLPFYSYEWTLFMHVLGTVLFLGNIVVSAAWLSLARRSRDSAMLRFAAEGVATTDAYFTLPGVLLLALNGGVLSVSWLGAGQASWLFLSIALFVLMVAVWMAVLIPAQRRMLHLSGADRGPGDNPSDELFACLKIWFRWGGVATLLPIVIMVLMVIKPNLW